MYEIYIEKIVFEDPDCIDGMMWTSTTWDDVYSAVLGSCWGYHSNIPYYFPCDSMAYVQTVQFVKGPCWRYVKDPVTEYVTYSCCVDFGEGTCPALFKVCWNEQFTYLDYIRVNTPPVYGEDKLCPQTPLIFWNSTPISNCYFICDN